MVAATIAQMGAKLAEIHNTTLVTKVSKKSPGAARKLDQSKTVDKSIKFQIRME